MAVISSDKFKSLTADFLWAAVRDLLYWAEMPQSEPRSSEWAEEYQVKINGLVKLANRAFDDDDAVCQKIDRLKSAAYDFIGMLKISPSLATTQVNEWTVRSQVRRFDELYELGCEFRDLSRAETDEDSGVVDSDYSEPLFKSEVALLLGYSVDHIGRMIRKKELRIHPDDTSARKKKVRVLCEVFPPGLKRQNERQKKLDELKA